MNLHIDPTEFAPLIETTVEAAIRRVQAERHTDGDGTILLTKAEAAKALGMGPWHRFRFIVFPQALRMIMPPLGNDFVAMIKDSSLVSVLGVADVTQLGKIYAAGSFRFFETYNIVALIYLFLTISISLALRRFERHLERKSGQMAE